jgi:hypothetical protein
MDHGGELMVDKPLANKFDLVLTNYLFGVHWYTFNIEFQLLKAWADLSYPGDYGVIFLTVNFIPITSFSLFSPVLN